MSFSLPHCPTAGQGSVPGLECIVLVALEPIWQGEGQVGVLLQSSDLNLLLQPPGRAEFNEQIWLHCWKLWPQGNELVVRFVSSWMVPGQLYCAILQILMPAQINQRYRLSRAFFSQQLCWLRPSINACGMPAPRKAWHSHVECKTPLRWFFSLLQFCTNPSMGLLLPVLLLCLIPAHCCSLNIHRVLPGVECFKRESATPNHLLLSITKSLQPWTINQLVLCYLSCPKGYISKSEMYGLEKLTTIHCAQAV